MQGYINIRCNHTDSNALIPVHVDVADGALVAAKEQSTPGALPNSSLLRFSTRSHARLLRRLFLPSPDDAVFFGPGDLIDFATMTRSDVPRQRPLQLIYNSPEEVRFRGPSALSSLTTAPGGVSRCLRLSIAR